ncbi:MAG TPA: hypothetical protein VHR55_08010 [Candidatus Limnocylindria bacterium]|nr:hypothetical protein [Candidatus Limnocylindria bacterium]
MTDLTVPDASVAEQAIAARRHTCWLCRTQTAPEGATEGELAAWAEQVAATHARLAGLVRNGRRLRR